MREQLLAEAGKSIEIHVVWTKVLPADSRELAATRAKELQHDGVLQYWDAEQVVGQDLVAVLPVGESPLAWDVYLFFEVGATWEEGGQPPFAALWTHQLGGADPQHFARGRIGERLATHLRALCGTDEERAEGAAAFLRKAGSVDGPFVGEGGDRSATFAAYERLRDHATKERLLALTSDKSAVVRCYAVQALAERHPDVDLLPVLLAHLGDLEEVETLSGCCGMVEKTGDAMIGLVRERLTGEQQIALAEALLGSELEERWRTLATTTFPREWRTRLRALAAKGDDAALIALARHRDEEDLPLLAAALARPGDLASRLDAMRAAEAYPDPRLLDALAVLEGRARDARPGHVRLLCAALAAQESEGAARVLGRLAAAEDLEGWQRDARLEALVDALEAHRVRPFAPLLWSLWRQRARLDPGTYRFLAELDPEAARARAEEDLRARPDEIDADAVPLLLDLLAPETQVDVIGAALRRGAVNDPLAARAAELRDPSFVAPLEKALEDPNPYRYLPAARALLAYADPAIEERLRAAVARHGHLRTGWGGEAMARLLAR